MSRDVILLNADFTFLNTISWKNAVRLIYKGKAQVVKGVKERLISNYEKTCSYLYPLVIRLIKFIRLKFKKDVPLTKRNVFVRDSYTCQYCGEKLKRTEATLDHIVPKSRGGNNSWENSATACKECNTVKGNQTPSEAKMYLKGRAYKPTIGEFVHLKSKCLGVDKLIEDLME